MYQAKSGVKNFSLYSGGGGSLDKKFFSQSEHVSSQIWCQKFFPLLRPGNPPPPDLRPGTPRVHGPGTPPTWTWEPPTWTWDPPYLDLDLGTPPPCGQTRRQVSKHYLPVVLRTRAVITRVTCFAGFHRGSRS